MKNILYILIISATFSCNISYPMQQSITTEKIQLLVCITVGCGISLYIINQYGHSLLHWFKSFYHKTSIDKKNNSSVDSNNLPFSPVEGPNFSNKIKTSIEQQNPSLIPILQMTIKDLDQRTAQYLQKKEDQIKGTTELHRACEKDNTKEVERLLQESTTDINAKRDYATFFRWNEPKQELGETPLHIACHNNNRKIVEILLTCDDIDITIQTKDGNTPLHIACKTGNQEIVQKLLTCNASNINTQNDKDESALYLSYFHKHKDIFSFLFSQDNIDLTNLLSLACERHDMNMITQLLNHKNIKLDNSKALYTACENGYDDIVTLLLTYNKDNCMKINDRSYNPLLIACKQIEKSNIDRIKFVTIIKALLNDPAIDINIKTSNGLTVFHCVVSDCELLGLLLDKDDRFISEKETSTSGCPSHMNQTPLHNAIEAGILESIFLLLEHGADISIKDCCKKNPCTKKNCYGYTPLVLACKKASEEIKGTTYKNIVEQLLQSSYVNQEIINSSQCLYELDLEKIDNSIPLLLLSHGADPNKISKWCGVSPVLKVAACNLPLLNLLIDQYKGDSAQKDGNNRTVLYRAFMSKKIKSPNDINFFKNFSEIEKKEFMIRELSIVAHFTPKNIFTRYPYLCGEQDIKKTNDYIKLFNSFVATCINHGKIDITAKITNNKTLLEVAYEQSQKRHESFYSLKKYCMHSSENICHYTHDLFHSKRYEGCDDCLSYVQYNELIVHGFIHHVAHTTIEQDIDKKIACIYKQEPALYYLKTTEERENQKNYLREQITKTQS